MLPLDYAEKIELLKYETIDGMMQIPGQFVEVLCRYRRIASTFGGSV